MMSEPNSGTAYVHKIAEESLIGAMYMYTVLCSQDPRRLHIIF